MKTIFISISFSGFSQIKVIYKGAEYFVYPKTQELNKTLNLPGNEAEERKLFDEYYGAVEMAKEERDREFEMYRKELILNYASKNELKALDANPLCFVETNYSMERDLEPSLDPLPDGNYIQYFSKVALGAKHPDICKGIVAGTFSIKNDQLEGNAVWFSQFGDSLKFGSFKNGVKEGVWRNEDFSSLNQFYGNYKKSYIDAKRVKSIMSLKTIILSYKEGLLDGPYFFKDHIRILVEGFYKQGEKTGTWREFVLIPPIDSMSTIQRIYYNSSLNSGSTHYIEETWYPVAISQLTKEYSYWDKKPVSKGVFVRNETNTNILQNEVRNKMYEAHINDPNYVVYDSLLPFDFYSMAEVAYNKSEFIVTNLPESEEIDNSYGESLQRIENTDDYSAYSEETYPNSYSLDYYDPRNIERRQNKLTDSLGYKPFFKYVKSNFTNGKKMYALNFMDSTKFFEDTLFYIDGTPFSVVSAVKDSNQYEHKIYDMKGKLYMCSFHDSIGNFIRETEGNVPKPIGYIEEEKTMMINGLKYVYEPYQKMYSYNVLDTLQKKALTENTLLYDMRDSTGQLSIVQQLFNANKRTLSIYQFSIFGDTVVNGTYTFSEDYNNYRFVNTANFGDFKEVSEGNGGFDAANHSSYTYLPDSIKAKLDSFPQMRIGQMYNLYDITEDKILMYKNKPYSGNVKILISKKDFKLSVSEKSTNLRISGNKNWSKKVYQAFSDEKAGKKTKLHNEIKTTIGFITDGFDPIQFSATQYLCPLQFPYSVNDYVSKNQQIASATGAWIDGKPSGKWVTFNKKGKIFSSVNFVNGEKEGEMLTFDIAQQPKKSKKGYEEAEYYNNMSQDTLPKKAVYFLLRKDTYKNDKLNGVVSQFNWMGQTIEQSNFKDGLQNGPSFRKSKMITTTFNHIDGQLDGLVITKIKLPSKRDSILLYELNYKGGNLQGESRSYHPSGKLAKRGFFLDGQPIDDYEAFDTLGFKYHYVKFLYSFPIEEKIYEANALSVKYLYNWKDSIPFYPAGFEISEGTESYLADEGMINGQLNQSYYGRPSLVPKDNLKYDMIKYYPNDTISRKGTIKENMKIGCWQYQNYDGLNLYEIDYFDTLLKVNDLVFKSKGIIREYDSLGETVHLSYIIEKDEKYDCSHSDHYEKRQFMTIQDFGNGKRMNGFVQNFYDNGSLQSEGKMKNGLPTGIWKLYENDGSLNEVGEYKSGKRNGRWLKGDLSKTNFMGDICLNPNMPNLEEKLAKEAKKLDVTISIYLMGKVKDQNFYEMEEGDEEK